MKDDRQLGRMGESEARKLAVSKNINVNSSHEHDYGWDQIWALPLREGQGPTKLPLDLHPGRASCMVQIKSSRGLTKAPNKDGVVATISDIKLSTWLELCRYLGPSFFLVFDYPEDSDGDVPDRAYLIHVDEGWIAKTLENARKRDKEPHHTTQTLQIRAVDELAPIKGATLLTRLDDAIGDNQQEYTAKKMNALSEVGYDGARVRLKVQVRKQPEVDPLQEMIEVALGLKKLPVTDSSIYDYRFDTESYIRDTPRSRADRRPLPSG